MSCVVCFLDAHASVLLTAKCQLVHFQAVQRRQDESERFESIPETLKSALMSFQTVGVKFALKRGTRTLIGDEMGLGKTVQAIALLAAHKDKWPAVIITPASLRGEHPSLNCSHTVPPTHSKQSIPTNADYPFPSPGVENASWLYDRAVGSDLMMCGGKQNVRLTFW